MIEIYHGIERIRQINTLTAYQFHSNTHALVQKEGRNPADSPRCAAAGPGRGDHEDEPPDTDRTAETDGVQGQSEKSASREQ